MSQLSILSKDDPLEQYAQIQKVFSLVGKAIGALDARAKWNLYDDLNATLETSTPEKQWSNLDAFIPRVQAAAEQEHNEKALSKLGEAREVDRG
ncbi:MAG: hypothetical protein KF716_15040 [Anaerolineae bacterium]|nr:hypothetical protein [Anaerolineae bacterium]